MTWQPISYVRVQKGPLLPSLVVAAVLLAVGSGFLASQAADVAHVLSQPVEILTGTPTGEFMRLGSQLRRVVTSKGMALETVPTDGSVRNIKLLQDQPQRIAIGEVSTLAAFLELKTQPAPTRDSRTAIHGTPIKLLTAMYDETLYVICQKGACTSGDDQGDWAALGELVRRGQAYVGLQDSGTRLAANSLMKVILGGKIDPPERLLLNDGGFDVAMKGLCDGSLRAAFINIRRDALLKQSANGGLWPDSCPALERQELRALGIPLSKGAEVEATFMGAKLFGMNTRVQLRDGRTIPLSDRPVQSYQAPALLLAGTEVGDAAVELVLRELLEARPSELASFSLYPRAEALEKTLTAKRMLHLELHPGARRFFFTSRQTAPLRDAWQGLVATIAAAGGEGIVRFEVSSILVCLSFLVLSFYRVRLRAGNDDASDLPPPSSSGWGSDRPLTELRDDRLGHSATVLALSEFLRNKATEPRLAIAVTGAWGTGKSSLMGMLRSELDRAGFRTAWFNAWHHQLEGRQLSALFNVIRSQAVPSLFVSLIPALRVRWNLIWARGWGYRIALGLALGFCLIAWMDLESSAEQSKMSVRDLLRWSFTHHQLQERRVGLGRSSLDKLDPFLVPDNGSCRAPASNKLKATRAVRPEFYCALRNNLMLQGDGEYGACRPDVQSLHGDCWFETSDQLLKEVDRLTAAHVPAVGSLQPSEKSAIVAAAEVLAPPPIFPTLARFIPLLALLGLLVTKGVSVYGLELLRPLRLLSGGGSSSRSDVSAAVEPSGTIERYRREFGLLTRALEGRLVVFIDDVDRCGKATVNNLLEMTNYLTDHGECFVVIGSAMEHVRRCIELDVPQEKLDEARSEYLRKLVHLELPVPPPSVDALFEAPSVSETTPTSRFRDFVGSRPLGLIVALALILAAALAYGAQLSEPATKDTLGAVVEGAHPSAPMPAGTTPDSATWQPPPPANLVLKAQTPPPSSSPTWTIQVAAAVLHGFEQLFKALKVNPFLWALSAAVLLLGALELLFRAAQASATAFRDPIGPALGSVLRAHDSNDLKEALLLWKGVLRCREKTPRQIKRFCNRTRWFALLERHTKGGDAVLEQHIVALAALDQEEPGCLERPDLASSLPESVRQCLAEHVKRWGEIERATIDRFRDLLMQIKIR